MTCLKCIAISCLENVISGVKKKSRVRVTMSSLVKTSVNWTIVQRKQDRKILCRIRGDFTWSVLETEVQFTFPRSAICICVPGQTCFLNFPFTIKEYSNIREKKFLYLDIFLWRAFWWFNFGDCFNIGKAFQNTETSQNKSDDVLESSSHQRHLGKIIFDLIMKSSNSFL